MASSTNIQWSYHTMYKWYVKNQDHPTDKVICIVYKSKKSSKDKTSWEPFIKRNIVYFGKTHVQQQQLFPNGLYTVIDDNKKHEFNMFFVFPLYETFDHVQVPLANHFRFVFNDRASVNKTNFHLTTYFGRKLPSGNMQYLTNHVYNDYPAQLNLPRDGDAPKPFTKSEIVYYKPALLDIIRYPWNHDRKSGGGKQKSTIPSPRRHPLSPVFSQMWRRVGFREMTAIGLRQENGHIIWSVTFKRKGREYENEAYAAYVFDTPTDDETEFQERLAALANPSE